MGVHLKKDVPYPYEREDKIESPTSLANYEAEGPEGNSDYI